MFKFNNNHIFTGYLKQLLSSFNLPTCRIYTREFAEYLRKNKKEDPRVIESFNTITNNRLATRINYLKNDGLFNYFWDYNVESSDLNYLKTSWKQTSNILYKYSEAFPGLTKTLNSPGKIYDTTTHEYLGEYLRFLRDYNQLDLMSLYNCFSNKIYNNIYQKHLAKPGEPNPNFNENEPESVNNVKWLKKPEYTIFDSQDPKYNIYAFPVKLFADYTIAIDCSQGIEMFCGFYNTALDTAGRSTDLIKRTYKKVNKTIFSQPFLYDLLNVKYWNYDLEIQNITQTSGNKIPAFLTDDKITRWDIANREQDLKLFIKVPVTCKSSITVLEGDFRNFNDFKYMQIKYKDNGDLFDANTEKEEDVTIKNVVWEYKQNHTIVNFKESLDNNLNETPFKPIGKLQLLAFNTGESYPFAERLVEYLSTSAITPIDEISDNISRVQKVMNQNGYYFAINGLWENKMQKILYDHIINSGPVELLSKQETHSIDEDYLKIKLNNTDNLVIKKPNNSTDIIIDKRQGTHKQLGHTNKSMLYDVLGYVDKDTEKWYASWKKENNKIIMQENIHNADIYNGLFDI